MGVATMPARRHAPAALDLVNPPCKGQGPIFTSTMPHHHAEAKKVCADCTVKAACLALAFAEAYPDGTYGGVLFVNGERRTL